MGNETSQLNGLNISEKVVEITDFWVHHHATVKDSCRYFTLKGGVISVFKGSAVSGPLWAHTSPLEKCSNNLLKYRHPSIARYISAWQQRSLLHLATEYLEPLAIAITLQSPLQILVGLNHILQALVFLHQQAAVSHNNVCIDAIYVTEEGDWKLGGLQFLSPFKELTQAFLKISRPYRYEKAVDKAEDNQEVINKVDQYAFAVLVDDVFKRFKEDDLPHLEEFKQYCKNHLQKAKPSERPPLSEVMDHDIFNHPFISIYKFLTLLPLKSEQERRLFFKTLVDRLSEIDEKTVARQLAGLLLARVTILDNTAQESLLPIILTPKTEKTNHGLFSESVYKEHIKPRITQIFGVHDLQVRLLMLKHFSKYVDMFTHEEVTTHILPELLLGIKDTDDTLVSATLVSLSELVPKLGATTVIGGTRNKIFSDGRPNSLLLTTHSNNCNKERKKSLRDFPCSEEISECSNESFLDNPLLLERPTPVGGNCIPEVTQRPITSLGSNSYISDNSEETWSDWDKDKNTKIITNSQCRIDETFRSLDIPTVNTMAKKTSIPGNASILAKSKKIRDISELDIKTQKIDSIRSSNDIDFFADMTPVIETKKNLVEEVPEKVKSKLDFVPSDDKETWGDGWDD